MPVLTEQLEEQAALYAVGALTELERTQFELILSFHEDLRALVRTFEETAVKATLETQCNERRPSADLKSRILGRLNDRGQQTREEGFVMASPDGLVRWVNAAFTIMCGYTLDELKGKRLGPILQGELTDPAAAARLRDAVHAAHPCTEALVNYHKNGDPYWVSINVTPIKDADGKLLWYVARELELPERLIGS